MVEDPFEEGKRYADFMKNMSNEERNEVNKRNVENSLKEHAEFKKSYKTGRCYVCHKKFASFDRNEPCFHWFLRPNGATKNDIKLVAEKFGFHRIQAYLRWMANEDGFGKNINDLIDEGTGKFIEVTIKYKEFEWAFSVTDSDLVGHETTENANYSHFHLQMKIEDRLFIKYSDFHIPFSRMDIINIAARRQFPDVVKHKFISGEGMQDLMTDEVIEHALRSPGESDEEDSAFNISTMVEADEGTTISGEEIYNIIQEAKRTGVTIASLMHKLPNASATVMVTPGRGVVEQAPRKGGRKKGA